MMEAGRSFGWFFGLYNAGLGLTAVMMTVRGVTTVLDIEVVDAAIAGFAGLGHMTITAGIVALFLALKKRVAAAQVEKSGLSEESVAA